MMVSKEKILSESILTIVLLGIVTYIFKDIEWSSKSLFSIIGFIIIGILSIYSVLKDSRIISMNKFYWYFQLVFMSIAPLCQYLSEYSPWGIKIDEKDIRAATYLIVFGNCIYLIFYRKCKIHLRLRTGDNRNLNPIIVDRYYSQLVLFCIVVCAVIGFFVLVKMIGFYNLFFRSENVLDIENSTINFIVRKFLTAFPAMAYTVFVFVNKKNKSLFLKIGSLLLAIFSLIANFPTSTTRYWMGTLFIGMFFSMYISRRESRIVDYGIIFGLLVVFPIFYMFKTLTIDDLLAGNIEFSGIVESFNTIDFDAFTLVARSVRYVRENGITWGQQLINIILFFIPRSIWSGKPITTNVLVASSQGQAFTNLSCPLVAEGYINFGILGIVLYCFIYAKINKYFDDLFWRKSNDEKINLINMLYPYLCVITIYINRGPLQPSFIQTIALCSPMFVINIFSQKVKLKNEEDEK